MDSKVKSDECATQPPLVFLRRMMGDAWIDANVFGVTTPNVKNRTLRKLDHSFEAAKGRRGLKAPLLSRPVACQV